MLILTIVPGYISRSVAGSYDNEGIAIFALMFTYFLWVSTLDCVAFQNDFQVVITTIQCITPFLMFFLHSYLMLFCVQIRSVKTGSVFWSTLAALSYFYMVSMNILRQYIHGYLLP